MTARCVRARTNRALGIALFALCAALGACTDNPGQPSNNRPPETGLVFVGDLDTTLYIQEVKWWGTDSDGDVVGFEYRWTPRTPLAGFDTSWIFTTDVRDTFALPTPSGYSEYTFAVRAIDDRGATDLTPASQTHPFANAAPTCSLTNVAAFADSLFPSLPLEWVARDLDGEATISRFLVWLDGNEANPLVIEDGTARSTGLSPADFDGAGQRTVFIQAVDSGQRGSEPDSFSAYFFPAMGRVLLVDDMTRTDPRGGTAPFGSGFARFADLFYATNLDTFYRQERQQDFSILDLERFPIQSRDQASRLLESYETIVWYDQIGDSMGSPALETMAEFLPDWIRGGGKMVLVSTYAMGVNVINYNPTTLRGDTIPEALFAGGDDRFRRVVAGIDGILLRQPALPSTYAFEGGVSGATVLEDLRLPGGFLAPVSFDIFTVRPEVTRLYTIPAGTAVSEADTLTAEGTAGLLRQLGAGRFVLLGFPYSRMGRSAGGEDDDTRFFPEFRKILALVENGA
ncbi:MAG: hypothetical protein ACKVU1_06585 [bacterium]